MTEPEVSVVVPTFRREKLVVEAVGSVLAQRGIDLEVLVLDDSEEGSARAAVEGIGDERVRYVKRTLPSRGRPAIVRNDGFELARGRFVHFLDDDDRLAEGSLLALASALGADDDAGVAFGRIEPFGDDAAVLARQRRYFQTAAIRARRARHRMRFVANLLFQPTLLVCSACMVRRDVARAIGGFDPHIPVCEDAEFYLRAIRASDVRFIDASILHYRTGAPSIMHNLKGNELARESYARIHAKYRRAHGAFEYYALKALARLDGRS